MRTKIGLSPLLAFALPAVQLFAQAWDPVANASGWARLDKDGSCTFYDPSSKKLVSWMRDGGIMGELDVSKLGQVPEKWVLDSLSNAWVVVGNSLHYVEKNGKFSSQKLPAEVGDLAWDAHGFVLSYKCLEPYVEKRDYKGGSVIWSYGNKPKKEEISSKTFHRIVVNDDENVILVSGANLAVDMIDGSKGKPRGKASFTFNGAAAPSLTLGDQGRGSIAWWLGKNVTFSAVPSTQLPSLNMQGLLLAKLNFNSFVLEFLPTGLTEDYSFIGALDKEAVFIAPKGGLAFVPIN